MEFNIRVSGKIESGDVLSYKEQDNIDLGIKEEA